MSQWLAASVLATLAFGSVGDRFATNIALQSNGCTACAHKAQAGFGLHNAIDGHFDSERGWAFDGDLPSASASFTFSSRSHIKSVTIYCGLGRIDHHITVFRIWVSNATDLECGLQTSGSMPFSDAVPALSSSAWRPLDVERVTASSVDRSTSTMAIAEGNVILTNGGRSAERVEIILNPNAEATALLLKVDGTDSRLCHRRVSSSEDKYDWYEVSTFHTTAGPRFNAAVLTREQGIVGARHNTYQRHRAFQRASSVCNSAIINELVVMGRPVSENLSVGDEDRKAEFAAHSLGAKTACDNLRDEQEGGGEKQAEEGLCRSRGEEEGFCEVLAGKRLVFVGDTRASAFMKETVAAITGQPFQHYLNPAFPFVFGTGETQSALAAQARRVAKNGGKPAWRQVELDGWDRTQLAWKGAESGEAERAGNESGDCRRGEGRQRQEREVARRDERGGWSVSVCGGKVRVELVQVWGLPEIANTMQEEAARGRKLQQQREQQSREWRSNVFGVDDVQNHNKIESERQCSMQRGLREWETVMVSGLSLRSLRTWNSSMAAAPVVNTEEVLGVSGTSCVEKSKDGESRSKSCVGLGADGAISFDACSDRALQGTFSRVLDAIRLLQQTTTKLVWIPTEPFDIRDTIHAQHNVNISVINAVSLPHILGIEGVASIPAWSDAIRRHDMYPDGVHPSGQAQRRKVQHLISTLTGEPISCFTGDASSKTRRTKSRVENTEVEESVWRWKGIHNESEDDATANDGDQDTNRHDNYKQAFGHNNKQDFGHVGGRTDMEGLDDCLHVHGDEEGGWVPDLGGISEYRLKRCKIRRIGHEEALRCLQNRRILLMGDSVTRYQYLSLAYFLLHGEYPPPTGTEGSYEDPHMIMPASYGSWRRHYLESSNLFGGRELCQCFRPEGLPFFHDHVENRFFGLEERNVSLSYIQVFGRLDIHGFYPISSETAHVLRPELYGGYEHNREGEIDFDWVGQAPAVIDQVVGPGGADVLVFNTGLWGELTDPEYVRSLLEAGRRAVCGEAGGECVWRRTSRRFVCDSSEWSDKYDRHCGRHHWKPEDTPDRLPISLAGEYGWRVQDVHTEDLGQEAFADHVHMLPFVYEEMNNHLLNAICPVKTEEGRGRKQ